MNIAYTLQAQYGAHNSAPANASLQYAIVPQATAVTGPQGLISVVIPNPPDDLSNVWFYRVQDTYLALDVDALLSPYHQSDTFNVSWFPLADGIFSIPISSITNRACQIPESQAFPFFSYNLWVQTERSNGVTSVWSPIVNRPNEDLCATTPFLDARQQLKDNLRFLMRAATDDSSFAFRVLADDYPVFGWPYPNYVIAGFYGEGAGNYFGYFSESEPIHANCFYKNFVFDPNNLNPYGLVNTGCSGGDSYSPDGISYLPCLDIVNYPTNYFNEAEYIINNTPIPSSQITASQSQWILPNDS